MWSQAIALSDQTGRMVVAPEGKALHVAREVIEKLIDDLDGGEAAETVTFGLDGATYEIDLTRRNAGALRKALERYVKSARKSSSSRQPTRRAATPAAKATKSKRNFDIVQLREWAGANNVAVPSRPHPAGSGRALQGLRRPLTVDSGQLPPPDQASAAPSETSCLSRLIDEHRIRSVIVDGIAPRACRRHRRVSSGRLVTSPNIAADDHDRPRPRPPGCCHSQGSVGSDRSRRFHARRAVELLRWSSAPCLGACGGCAGVDGWIILRWC